MNAQKFVQQGADSGVGTQTLSGGKDSSKKGCIFWQEMM